MYYIFEMSKIGILLKALLKDNGWMNYMITPDEFLRIATANNENY